jgi:AraC-like DNA-binding protein
MGLIASGPFNGPAGTNITASGEYIVIFPHGDPHIIGNGPPVPPLNHGLELDRIFSQGLKPARVASGGEITRFVCGYMACDPHVSKVLLGGLPPLLRVEIGNDASGKWLENSIRFSVAEAGESCAGAEAVRARLSEVLFVETLRRYVSTLPAGTKSAGVSPSVLAERFQHYLGGAPIAYLTRWRLQLAAQRLATSSDGVARIAADVGYRSEAAFNRAFKREFGTPPARFRRSKSTAAVAGELYNQP